MLHSREIGNKFACNYLSHSDTQVNAHYLLQLTVLCIEDTPLGLDLYFAGVYAISSCTDKKIK